MSVSPSTLTASYSKNGVALCFFLNPEISPFRPAAKRAEWRNAGIARCPRSLSHRRRKRKHTSTQNYTHPDIKLQLHWARQRSSRRPPPLPAASPPWRPRCAGCEAGPCTAPLPVGPRGGRARAGRVSSAPVCSALQAATPSARGRRPPAASPAPCPRRCPGAGAERRSGRCRRSRSTRRMSGGRRWSPRSGADEPSTPGAPSGAAPRT